MSRRKLCILAMALGLVAGAAEATGIALQSHRAVYELVLKRARPGSGIGDVSGRFVMEWLDACDGYVLNQRILTRILDASGEESVHDYRSATWESQDGQRLRFSTRSEVDGELSEEVSGLGELRADGGGVATFVKPEAAKLVLPAGTLFPTEHTLLLLRAAREGKTTIDTTIFDGSGENGLYRAFAVIGDTKVNGAPRVEAELVAGQPVWRFGLAYFQHDDTAGTPEFEVAFRMYGNGISSELELDYQDFSLSGRLARIESIPKPGC
ncbi:MAG: DUF1849 family protein [Alphaproteobacteria bacterium]|nr:DUF1849 family protein [Alphaproteobacteria bacterium]